MKSSRAPSSYKIWGLLTLIFTLSTLQLHACNCDKLTGKYTKLTVKLAAAEAAGDGLKASILKDRIVNLVKKNWKPIPGCPAPALPAAWCPEGDGDGERQDKDKTGRVGPGASVFSGTHTGPDTVTVSVFLRSADPIEIELVQLSLQSVEPLPIGVTLLDNSFTDVVLPPLGAGDVLVPVRLVLDGPIPIGTTFRLTGTVVGTDGLWPDSIQEQITVSDVDIVPLTPIAEVPPTGSFPMTWRIRNPNPYPVTKSISLLMIPDPKGFTDLNDGTPYAIFNSYPEDKTPLSAGSVTIGAGDFIDITKIHVSNEICEPTMLGCCGLSVDGGYSCIQAPNAAAGPFTPPISSAGKDLIGTPMGGFVRINIDWPPFVWQIPVPTFPGQPIEQIIDQLAIQVTDRYLHLEDFPFQAAALDNFFDIFGPSGANIQFQSFDPGLNFVDPGCEAPGWEHAEVIAGDQVTLSWFTNPNALSYQVQLTPAFGPPQNFFVPAGSTSLNTAPLAPGTYSWKIASNCALAEVLSPFSYPDTFQVLPCNNGDAPANPVSALLSNRVELTWDPVANTTACQVRGSRISPPGPTRTQVISGLESSSTQVPFALLGAGTTWEWQVRCACNTSPVNATPYTAPNSFAVPTLRQAQTRNWTVLSNPVHEVLNLSITNSGSTKEPLTFALHSIHGQVMMEETVSSMASTVKFDLSHLLPGLYLLQASDGYVEKVTIVHP
jgi:hypothetical protein